MELKSTANPIDAAGPVKQVLANLFYGWGYNFYRRENQLRADDLLIRGKLSELLGQCRTHAAALESDFRRAHLPPPTRQQPFPDAAAVSAAQALERAVRKIETLETAIRNAPVPEMDRIHQRHRNERTTLEQLVAADGDLVLAVVTLRDGALALTDGASAAAQLTHLLEAQDIQALWTRREQILSVLQ
jgi:hypothetical protein